MKWRTGSILSLTLGDRFVQCAQIAHSGSRWQVQRLARFALPVDTGYDHPEELGKALKVWLAEHHFATHRAIVGVPARWLVAHGVELPPADTNAALAMARLQAERLSAGDDLNIIYDCAGDPARNTTGQTLLVGILTKQFNQINQMAAAAGLEVTAITATALAVADLLTGTTDQTVMLLQDHGTEILIRQNGATRLLRHLRSVANPTQQEQTAWTGELRRMLTLSGLTAAGQTTDMMIVDAIGLDADDHRRLLSDCGAMVSRVAGLDELKADVRPGALNGSSQSLSHDRFISAIAVGVAGLNRHPLPVDFTHSRLAPPPVRHIGRRTVMLVATAVALIVGLVGLYLTVQQREAEAIFLNEWIVTRESDVKAQEALTRRVVYGRTYFENRLPALDCLKEIATTYRENDPIWTTTFSLREASDGGRGQLQGKASNQRVILEVLDRLRNNNNFSNVQLQNMRDVTGRTSEIIFAITFTYQGGTGPS